MGSCAVNRTFCFRELGPPNVRAVSGDVQIGQATSYGPWHEMSHGLSNAATFPPKRQMTEETIPMKAIVVTDQAWPIEVGHFETAGRAPFDFA